MEIFKKQLDFFSSEIDSHAKFVETIRGNSEALKHVILRLIGNRIKSQKEENILKSISIPIEQLELLYEMSFISLYAKFDSLQYMLISTYLKRFPRSILGDKKILASDAFTITSIRELRANIVDDFAIENSQSIYAFSKFFLTIAHKKLLSNELEKALHLLQMLRNAYVHSGGKTTVLFNKSLGKLLGRNIKNGIGEEIDFITKEKAYKVLLNTLKSFIKEFNNCWTKKGSISSRKE